MFGSEQLAEFVEELSETTEGPPVSWTVSKDEDGLILKEGLVVGLFFVSLIESRLGGGLSNEDADLILSRFWYRD